MRRRIFTNKTYLRLKDKVPPTSEEIVAAKQLHELKVELAVKKVQVFFIDKANRFSLHEAITLTRDV